VNKEDKMKKNETRYQIRLNKQVFYISYKKKTQAQSQAKKLRKDFKGTSIRVHKIRRAKWIAKR
jgi:hypothetical protein